MKKKKTRRNKYDRAFNKLRDVYSQIPKTEGCLEQINKEGGCGGICCKVQTPQVLYVEFLHSWNSIIKNWSAQDIIVLARKCLTTYLSNVPTKGCVFWEEDTKQCKQHSTRCYNCRLYSIVPKEEFQKQYDKIKELLKDQVLAVVREQCDKVKTVNKPRPTESDTKEWWESLIKIEKSIGVEEKQINDRSGGSYRTYHDHVLMHLFDDKMLSNLTVIRVNGDAAEKELAVKKLTEYFREYLYNSVQSKQENKKVGKDNKS